MLEEYQAGRLEMALARRVAEHVASCHGCAEGAAALGQTGKLLGALPREAAPATIWLAVRERVGDRYAVLATPLGVLYVAYGSAGIRRVGQFDDGVAFERDYARQFQRPLQADPAPPPWVSRALDRFWSGDRPAGLKLDLRTLSPFQRAVLEKTREIPRGEVRPYAWVAKEIGHPKAVRAVGSALRQNPVPLLIPCHRVVHGDGTTGEYAWGAALKRQLLAREGVDAGALAATIKAGRRFQGSRTTNIFCLPTCHQARRIKSEHRVAFRSAQEAVAAGYRPCKLCRPA